MSGEFTHKQKRAYVFPWPLRDHVRCNAPTQNPKVRGGHEPVMFLGVCASALAIVGSPSLHLFEPSHPSVVWHLLVLLVHICPSLFLKWIPILVQVTTTCETRNVPTAYACNSRSPPLPSGKTEKHHPPLCSLP